MNLGDVVIVLSRPAEAGNVGAICRAMKNMGLSRLRLVKDTAAKGPGLDEAVICSRAVHAADVWERAESFGSLAEAVLDMTLIIGTTRRRGRGRKDVSMTPSETASFLKNRNGPAALVFGNERSGLEDEEIKICNLASHIPANDKFPSLNLSHAVQIYAYEVFKAFGIDGKKPDGKQSDGKQSDEFGAVFPKGQWVPLDEERIGALVGEITSHLKILGFYKQPGREEQERFFRDIFSRAALTEREGRYFAEIISKAAHLVT
jgi:tRNA/rRNA methyltransferase/tRNA (cytidine32/uridine32-2'-O)-methyltransferase